jgi:hypothetical protein
MGLHFSQALAGHRAGCRGKRCLRQAALIFAPVQRVLLPEALRPALRDRPGWSAGRAPRRNRRPALVVVFIRCFGFVRPKRRFVGSLGIRVRQYWTGAPLGATGITASSHTGPLLLFRDEPLHVSFGQGADTEDLIRTVRIVARLARLLARLIVALRLRVGLRDLMFTVTNETKGVGALTESLMWGQQAYLPTR